MPWGIAQVVTVAEIAIQVQPVFDLSRPEEAGWLGRTANRLHLATHESVIRRALLFKEGDRVEARSIYESERALRALAFVKDARILPEPLGPGRVRARVRVRHAWTLALDAGFQQVGGQRTLGFGLLDQNFLGSGKTVGFQVSRNPERTERQFSFRDPQLLGGRWRFEGDYQEFTDGHGRRLSLERPFYALDTRWSCLFQGETRMAGVAVCDGGRTWFRAPHWADTLYLGTAWRLGTEPDRAVRAGLAVRVEDHRYGPPESPPPEWLPAARDRRQRGLALTLGYRRDAYRSFSDIKGMDTPEDYNLAWEGSLELGGFSRRLGSTRPGPYLRLAAARGWSAGPGAVTLFEGRLGAGPRGGGEDLRVDASLASYVSWAPAWQLAGYACASYRHRPGPEQLCYLGGAEGLRGYPNALHPGDAHWVVSLEQRWFTDYRWWALFRLGCMLFADLGAVRRLDGNGWSRVYPDLGFALRLGDLKSSLARVLVLSVAFPLEAPPGHSGWQVGIGNSFKF